MSRKPQKTEPAAQTGHEDPSSRILDDLISRPVGETAPRGPVVGKLCGWTAAGWPLVDFPGNPESSPLPAISTVPLDVGAVGRDVVMLFEEEQIHRPIIVGLVQPTVTETIATVDDQVVVLEGKERVELRCGKAKLILTSEGKVLVKGTDILSRSEGPNRVKGASIQLN